jgi:hypothetical protein
LTPVRINAIPHAKVLLKEGAGWWLSEVSICPDSGKIHARIALLLMNIDSLDPQAKKVFQM